jgi:hypothetical protein
MLIKIVTVVAAEPDAAQDRISGIVHDDELGNPGKSNAPLVTVTER